MIQGNFITTLSTALLLTMGISISWAAPTNIITEAQKLTQSNPMPWDFFGYDVDVDGDTVFFGTLFGTGVYEFQKNPDGNWYETYHLTRTSYASTFGRTVAIEGDTLLVSDTAYDADPADLNFNSGIVYVYQRDAYANWIEVTELAPSEPVKGGGFGQEISLNGDTALVSGWTGEATYVFTRDAQGIWSEQAKLTASDAVIGDYFGRAVALSGDMALVSAPFKDASGIQTGAAYIFERDTQGVWSETQILSVADAKNYDLFGFAVAFAGTTAMVSARSHTYHRANGAVYVFEKNTQGQWLQKQELNVSDSNRAPDAFGDTIFADGNKAVIGSSGGNDIQGSAYLFNREPDGTWIEAAKFIASDDTSVPGDGATGDGFGQTVALTGTTVLVGAHRKEAVAGDYVGAAYVFEAAAGLPPIANDVEVSGDSGSVIAWLPDVSDPNAATLSCAIESNASNGNATVLDDCSAGSYQSGDGFVGIDSFAYTVSNGAATSLATVTVTVNDIVDQCQGVPIAMVTTDGAGQSSTVNQEVRTTFTGKLTTTDGLVTGNRSKVSTCSGERIHFIATGAAYCLINNVATATEGYIQVGDKLVCSSKPDGSDVDQFTVKNGL